MEVQYDENIELNSESLPGKNAYAKVSKIDVDEEDHGQIEEHDKGESKKCIIYKVCKQLVLFMTFMCIGLCNLTVGTSLIDIKYNVGLDFEEISLSIAMRSAGGMAASLFGGILISKFYKRVDLIISLALAFIGVAILVIPYLSTMFALSIVFFLAGIAEVFLITAVNALVCSMWGMQSSAPLHSLHCGAAFGGMIGPQIVKPFLGHSSSSNITCNTTGIQNSGLEQYANVTTNQTSFNILLRNSTPSCTSEPVLIGSRINLAFVVVSVLSVTVALIMLVLYLVGKPKGIIEQKPKTKVLEVINPATCAQGNMTFGVQILILLFFYYFHVIGGEWVMSQFIFSYAVKGDLKMSPESASDLSTTFSTGFLVGRFLGIFIAIKLRPVYMISLDIAGDLVAIIVLAFVGYRDGIIIWIFVAAFGYFDAQLYGAGVAWTNRYIKMYPTVVSVIGLGAYSGGFFYQWLTGYLFENYGPRSFFFLLIASCVCLALTFIPMQLLGYRQGERDHDDSVEVDKDTSVDCKETEDCL